MSVRPVPSTSIQFVNADFELDAVQPTNDGQAAGMREQSQTVIEIPERRLNLIGIGINFEDKVGLGRPTENPYDGRDSC